MDDSERMVYRPGEVARMLRVSPSTLRVYSTRFAPLLSSTVRRDLATPGGSGTHRRYTPNDVTLLHRAKRFLDTGLSYEATLEQLAGAARP